MSKIENFVDESNNNNSPRIRLNVPNKKEWQVYQNSAKRDVIFANYAYGDLDHSPEELREIATKVPSDFQLILCTDFLDDTKAHMYRGAVFVNHLTKEVIFANAGTRFGMHSAGAHDLYNDAYIMLEQTPPKIESAAILNQMVLDSLGEAASAYKFHYTGHSLGAAISDIAAADMALRCRGNGIKLEIGGEKKISTMTFENPGARKIIQRMYEENGLPADDYAKDADYRGINNKRNLINQSSTHAGRMWEMQIEGENNDVGFVREFIIYLARKFEPIIPIIPRILETFAYGQLKDQIDGHKLGHFDDVLCKETKGAEIRDAQAVERNNYYLIEILLKCKKVLYQSEIFSYLTKKKEEYGDVEKQAYVMQHPDGEVVTASTLELQRAVTQVKDRIQEKSFTDRAKSSKSVVREEPIIDTHKVPTAIEVLNEQRGRVV